MIYLHKRAAASIYRAELRERVAAIGGQWLVPDRRGLSELEGFSREVLRSFSQRRNAIEAELERTGRSGPRASEAACLKTRRDKLDVELVELRDTWAERARALGVTREKCDRALGRNRPARRANSHRGGHSSPRARRTGGAHSHTGRVHPRRRVSRVGRAVYPRRSP